MGKGTWFHKARLYLTDTAAGLSRGAGKGPGNRTRVLVVRPDGIGDFVLFTDAMRGIRMLYPPGSHEITLVANASLGEIASAPSLADRLIRIDRRMFLEDGSYRWRIMREFRRSGYEVALNPVYSRMAMIDDAIMRVTKAPERIGWDGALDNISKTIKWLTDRWYTRRIPNGDEPLMELERNARFVREIGLGDFRASLPVIPVLENWKKSAEELILESNILRPYLILLPGTGLPPERAWPPDRYGELARLAAESEMGDVLVCGGEGDRSLGRQVAASSESGRVFDLTGRTTLETLAALMSKAEAVIGSDTGGVHLAAAVGAKTISITGGAYPGRFFPYQVGKKGRGRDQEGHGTLFVVMSSGHCRCPNWSCTRNDWKGGVFPCISEIGVDEVFQALKKIQGVRAMQDPQEP
jgi:ADP-heptose:LPS heptosyltransferase